jgi:hypothetical protein
MSESTMRSRVVKILKRLDAQPVENMVGAGMPDIYCLAGWIECKKTKHWPQDPARIVRLDHPLMASQKIWIRRHLKRGGRAWVLIQIAQEFLLLDGAKAVSLLGDADRQRLIDESSLHCEGWSQLEEELPNHLEA